MVKPNAMWRNNLFIYPKKSIHHIANTNISKWCGSICLSVCLSIYLSICLFVYPSVCLSPYMHVCVYLSIYLSVYLSIYLPVNLSCLFSYLSIYLYTCFFACQSACHITCQFTYQWHCFLSLLTIFLGFPHLPRYAIVRLGLAHSRSALRVHGLP